MFGFFNKPLFPKPPQNLEEFNKRFTDTWGLPPLPTRADLEAEEEERQRNKWFRDRLWYNGKHTTCCGKCLQAGYVMALLRVGRLDLLGEYPELITVYEELKRDGMLDQKSSPRR